MLIIGTSSSIFADVAGDPTKWSEYGLAGLVIFALFGLVVFLLRQHKDERTEWKNQVGDIESTRSEQSERFIKVQSELSVAVRDLTNNQKESLALSRQIHENHITDRASRNALPPPDTQ